MLKNLLYLLCQYLGYFTGQRKRHGSHSTKQYYTMLLLIEYGNYVLIVGVSRNGKKAELAFVIVGVLPFRLGLK